MQTLLIFCFINMQTSQVQPMLKGIDRSHSKYALRLTRRDLLIWIGLLTGHVDLNWHLTLMKVRSNHICPLTSVERKKRLLFFISLGGVAHFHSQDLLFDVSDHTDLVNIRIVHICRPETVGISPTAYCR